MRRDLFYTVKPADLPCSLKNFLRRQGYSGKLLMQLRQADLIRVNEGFHRLIDPVAVGDRVSIHLPEEEPPLIPNPQLKLDILYEDEDLLVLDKPAGMLVHPAGRDCNDAIANFCAARYPQQLFRPIGRLDRNTTGACLIAKNNLAAAVLNGRVDKDYYALAEGLIEEEEGLIDQPLLRVAGSSLQRVVDPAGQPSQTRYFLLRRLPELGEKGHSWLRLQILTGRTHQIRAHLSYLGHPLAGDSLYGGSEALIQRHALHCGELRFRHPVSGEPLRVCSPLAADIARLLAQAGLEWPGI